MSIDLLISDAYVYVDRDMEIADGWVAIKGNRVHAVGKAGEEPLAGCKISAHGRLVTRSFAPASASMPRAIP
ncbi:hypothetical protein [Manganibacter manganicus]|uniref:Amidohydrolase-related domain-containing protein n=1 Tax=Manganibacter manganicus TaxID=1873176 RepID=A0A1V8RQ50_9HYPH|nr:hypothetical protein [Pseudaminobacter manganicus]OQM75307.1 hypothetical protein BFN67_18605 [Pseudaminobacter manganicus]